jgi:hypothetical protein
LGRKVLPFPCLAQLAERIYTQTSNLKFLTEIFPRIQETCLAWFDPSLDSDQDGFPEWAVLAQTGWSDHPTFNIFNPEHLATRIATTESFALGKMLVEELVALQKIARIVGDQVTLEHASALQAKLTSQLEAMHTQFPEVSCWDRDSHQQTCQAVLFEGSIIELEHQSLRLAQAARINVKLLIGLTAPKPTQVHILGESPDGKPIEETIPSAALSRLGEFLFFTTEHVYQQIERICFSELSDQTWLRIYVADLTLRDIGWYLAYTPEEKLKISELTEGAKDEFNADEEDSPQSIFASNLYGLPNYEQKTEETIKTGSVNPAWNSLVLRHLLEVGAKPEAAELFTSLMRGAVQVLRKEHRLFEAYYSQNALPLGKSNGLTGLLPLQIFLELAGIKLLAPDRVQVAGEYPFPGQLSLRYRRVEVVREGKNTTVTLPDGSVHHHYGSQARMFFTKSENI